MICGVYGTWWVYVGYLGGIWEPSAFNCDLVHDLLGDNLCGHAMSMYNDEIDPIGRQNLMKLTDDASLKKFHDYCRQHSCVNRNRSSHGKFLPMCTIES